MKRSLPVLVLSALVVGLLAAPARATDFEVTPHLLRDATPGAAPSAVDGGVALGSKYVYGYYDGPNHSYEPWVTDGTATGTKLLKDINPGPQDSQVGDFVAFGGKAYFRANDVVHGNELWVTDGTPLGTKMVKDVLPGAGDSKVTDEQMQVVGNTLFFVARTQTHDDQLWKTDGTTSGTTLVTNIGTPANGANINQMARWGNKLVFQANDGAHGAEPWTSDGTPAGTKLLKDLNTTGDANPGAFTVLGTKLVFAASAAGTNASVWTSDGTAAGTTMVPGTVSIMPTNFVANSGRVLFSGSVSGAVGGELWSTDGVTASVVKDINPTVGESSFIHDMTAFNGKVYFGAADASGNNELWRTDGTSSGTTKVRDISLNGGSWPAHFQAVGSTLFFRAKSDPSGYELWRTDGTTAGTQQVNDLWPGTQDSSAAPVAAIANTLFFEASTPVTGEELWAYTTRGSTTTGYPRAKYSLRAAKHKRIYVTVKVRASGTTPTGIVVLKKGSLVVGRGVLSAGVAKIRITRKLPKGVTKVRAYYAGSLRASLSRSAVIRVRVR